MSKNVVYILMTIEFSMDCLRSRFNNDGHSKQFLVWMKGFWKILIVTILGKVMGWHFYTKNFVNKLNSLGANTLAYIVFYTLMTRDFLMDCFRSRFYNDVHSKQFLVQMKGFCKSSIVCYQKWLTNQGNANFILETLRIY
jgi:hypothetical protein